MWPFKEVETEGYSLRNHNRNLMSVPKITEEDELYKVTTYYNVLTLTTRKIHQWYPRTQTFILY